MGAIRTQIYLTEEQRRRIDERRKHEGKTLAQIVREALDAYLQPTEDEIERILEETYGSIPDLTVPSRKEWRRRAERLARY